jgi:endonuclease/exonuclease/phosphatase family metal-dependent hydrolase
VIRPLLFGLAVAALAGLAVIGCATLPDRRPPAEDERHLTVMTWNVNFGVRGDDEARRAILDTDADVVFLQESTPAWERWAREHLSGAYPHQRFDHCCRAGGLAVLSKTPFEVKDIIEAPSGWFPAARVLVETALGQVQVLNVHLHPPVSESGGFVSGYFTTDPVRHDELSRYLVDLDPDLPTLILGDFNETRGLAVRTLEDLGFACAVERFTRSAITWRWQLPALDLEQNLDHIFAGPGLRAIDFAVVEAGRSDHLPVVAVLIDG